MFPCPSDKFSGEMESTGQVTLTEDGRQVDLHDDPRVRAVHVRAEQGEDGGALPGLREHAVDAHAPLRELMAHPALPLVVRVAASKGNENVCHQSTFFCLSPVRLVMSNRSAAESREQKRVVTSSHHRSTGGTGLWFAALP